MTKTAKIIVRKGPFTVHEVWSEASRTFEYEVRHGDTVQTRGRYRLHAEATAKSWNDLVALGA